MKETRTIRKIITGQDAVDGAGVKLVREIGYHDVKDFDPFLLLDAFDSTDPSDYIKGFPWHPHRGIETITYLIEGEIEHGDSMGNHDSIRAGDCQWMTAGSGIIHQEMPKPSERLLGAQLWLNLPAKDKMTQPAYHAITRQEIPVIDENKTKVRILSGSYRGNKGAMEGEYVKALYLDVEMEAGSEWLLDTGPEDTLFIYIIKGEAAFGEEGGKLIPEKHVVLFSEGNTFRAKTQDKGIRFLLMSGKPLREPIAWGGPIVMNTRKELDQAFEELENNTFIRE
jgi:redox-sensitive bicupin YhaK (pirin superfamily)